MIVESLRNERLAASPLEKLIQLQGLIEDRLRYLMDEHPVQVNAALTIHRNSMAIFHGEDLGEPQIDSSERDKLYSTDGLAANKEEQCAFLKAHGLLMMKASIANRKADPEVICKYLDSIDRVE